METPLQAQTSKGQAEVATVTAENVPASHSGMSSAKTAAPTLSTTAFVLNPEKTGPQWRDRNPNPSRHAAKGSQICLAKAPTSHRYHLRSTLHTSTGDNCCKDAYVG